jgi:hypothetical protein
LIDTPVGQPCDFCHQPIVVGDYGAIVPSTSNPEGPWVPQHAFCQAVEDNQLLSAMLERTKAWAALWKRAASRYRADLRQLQDHTAGASPARALAVLWAVQRWLREPGKPE